MRTSRIIGSLLLASITAFAVATTPSSAFAGPKGQGHKGAKVPAFQQQGAPHAGQKFCPPGLMNKGCIPPGQRKKWAVGHALPGDIAYRVIYNWRDYDLGPPPYGHVYGAVDRDILLIRAATRVVVDAVLLAALLE